MSEFNLSEKIDDSVDFSWDSKVILTEDVKEFIKRKNAIPNKSLESTGLDLCGFSQDDVWEEAIKWFKNEEDKLAGEELSQSGRSEYMKKEEFEERLGDVELTQKRRKE